jgi:hypothetical protein
LVFRMTLRPTATGLTAGAALKPGATMLQVLAGDLIEDGGVGNLSDPRLQAEFEPLLQIPRRSPTI